MSGIIQENGKRRYSFREETVYMGRKRKPKMEYRYYEISQDLPVMALSGKKWEYLFVDVEEILKEVL